MFIAGIDCLFSVLLKAIAEPLFGEDLK